MAIKNMKILPISSIGTRRNTPIINDDKFYTKNLASHNSDYVSFQRLLPQNANIKIAFFDIDETLKHWGGSISDTEAQKIRNSLFSFIKKNNIISVYSSDRGFDNIQSLIADGTLATPSWIVSNNGGYIYKNVNGKFEEIKSWSEGVAKNFDKNKVRETLVKIANQKENMFSADEWAKIPPQMIPDGQRQFRGSKITEYIGHNSPTSIRLIMAPGMYEKNVETIEQTLKNNGIEAGLTLFHYSLDQHDYKGLRKYFDHKTAADLANHYAPRSYPDGSADSLLISATDKGMASEYIRKSLGLKKDEVFAAGDGENDFSNANKGYYFALFSNAVEGLRKMISQTPRINIIETNQPGVEGILEVLT